MDLEKMQAIEVEIVRHRANRVTGPLVTEPQSLWPEAALKGFVVQAKHWGGERTHA